jgi:hypothetical protein
MIQTPSTAGTPVSCYLYDVSLGIPAGRQTDAPFFLEAIPIMETGLRSQGIDGLLGRDVLAECVFTTNGPIGMMTLSY